MKRVLIITYYWPPAGGPGVQRWLNFVKYFREFGIEPIVYVPENPHYPIIDESFAVDVPQGIEIIKFQIKEPYKLAALFSKKKTKKISSGIISKTNPSLLEKLMLYVRGNFFIPDARVGWVKPSVIFLKNYISKNPVDIVISTGPPHSLHLIGMNLNEELNLPWIADFRDPWTSIHYHKSLRLNKFSKVKHHKLESKVLQSADAIVVTSPGTKAEFEMMTRKPIHIITNGFEISKKIVRTPDVSFSIAHIGSLLSNRNPEILWKVLSKIASENKDFAKDFKIVLAGAVSEEVMASLEKFNLNENVEMLGYVSHTEALQLQHNAQVLLLLEMDVPETRAIIPGKLFEYLAAKRPIIALGPKGSDIEEIIDKTKCGKFFTYFQEDGLRNLILQYYQLYKNNSLEINSENIDRYSRRELTQRMASLINDMLISPKK